MLIAIRLRINQEFDPGYQLLQFLEQVWVLRGEVLRLEVLCADVVGLVEIPSGLLYATPDHLTALLASLKVLQPLHRNPPPRLLVPYQLL